MSVAGGAMDTQLLFYQNMYPVTLLNTNSFIPLFLCQVTQGLKK